MDSESGRPLKRFKHQSYQATLKNVHLPPASAPSRLDDDIPDSESHFNRALNQWRQLNLSPAFLHFAAQVHGLSVTVPLLLHHCDEIVDLWIDATKQADDDALRALLDLLQKLVHDLRGTLELSYMRLLETLLTPLPRSQSAETLTILLGTLSLFLKQLLGSTTQRLEETWSVLTSTLTKCNPEVRRAGAEVWATILRRCKGDMRNVAVTLILRDLEIIPDGGAWMFIYAFKSVTHALHTSTAVLFEELLTVHLSAQYRSHTATLMRRVITAVTHHCDKAEQFSPISDLLVSRFLGATPEELPYLMPLLSTAFSVRKGSRMTQNQISRVLTHLAQRSVSQREHVLSLGTATLMAGEMPVWMGSGRRFIESSWQDPMLGLQLAGSLSGLDWGGWRLIELPFTLKHTVQSIDSHPLPTLTLLASLVKAERLGDADDGWLRRMTTCVQARLKMLDFNGLDELKCILALSPILPSIGQELVHLATNALDSSSSQAESQRAEPRIPDSLAAQVFGACAKALAELPSLGWSAEMDISAWITRAVTQWPNCQSVLSGLVAVLKQPRSGSQILFSDVYPGLQHSILSHRQQLRLDALQILTSPLIEETQTSEVLRRCHQGEESALDVQGVRERLLKITAAPQVVKDDDHIGADICARWLIAQLKVNLRPLWTPAAKALAVLAQRFGDLVWNLSFTELEAIVHGKLAQDVGSISPKDGPDVTMEVERSWRDPSAAKLRSIVNMWSDGDPPPKEPSQNQHEILDVTNYEVQMLHALGEFASLTQRYNAGLVRLFLSFCSPDLPSKPPRARLSGWITLFSKLDNPKSFHQTSKLQALYRSLLAHPDRNLQSVALTCILNHKSPHLLPYEAHFRALLDSTKWRDELTSFDIASIGEEDRSEAVDIIIRMFFGMMLERHGRTKGADRRASLLSALGGCREGELRLLIDLMLEPFSLSSSSSEVPDSLEWEEKQQAGFMNLLGDIMKRMGSRVVTCWPSLLLITIRLVAVEQQEAQEIDDDSGPTLNDAPLLTSSLVARATRTVRQLGVKRFTDFFRCDTSFEFEPYLPSAFAGFISPRLAILEVENSQSPSAMLQLFHEWSMHRRFVFFLVAYDDRVLPKVYACLQAVHVKPEVVSRIFDIVEHILTLSEDDSEVADRVLKPHISALLDALSTEFPTSSGSRSDLLHRQVGILSQVAPFASSPSQARQLLQHFSPLLKRPHKVIPEKIKVHLLKIIQSIIPIVDDFRDCSSSVYAQTYDLFANSFKPCPPPSSRPLTSLNAFTSKRIDEPDFSCRLQAFSHLNEGLYSQLSAHEWHPVLYNMLQSIQDPDELVVRTNAAYSLKRFIEILSKNDSPDIENLFMRTLFPALKNGLLSKVELVRTEILGVLAYGVSKCDSISALSELRPLLADGDSEANFFNNVHHIQTHRRTRALRRLVEYVENSGVRSTTIAEIFLPLTGHFIVNAPTTDHILVDVAIVTTGSLAHRLNWGAYNSLVRRYMSLIKAKSTAERACVRTLVAVLENFRFSMDAIAVEDVPVDVNQNDVEQMDEVEAFQGVEPEPNATTVDGPRKKIADAVSTRLLPNLLQHLENQCDNEDILRIPVSVGIAQVACHLPKTSKDIQLSRLLTVLSQVFRSKSQDTRALARESLCKIAVIIGPSYLARIMTELRAALLRGPHLHILATVAHALLVHVTSSPNAVTLFKDLDECAADVAHVSAEVIFGQSGQDVRTEGFTTTVLEVRGSSSKGLDAFAILARNITPSRISAILNPIKGIMHETGTSKTLQLVDDVLRRISVGLNANKHLAPPEYLSLCHTLIQQNSRFLKEAPRPITGKKKGRKDFVVQTKRRLDKDEDHFANNSFRFVVLGLDLFSLAFRRGRFDIHDSHVISRLESMVAVIGNTLYSHEAPVVVQGLKAAALIIKCPLKSIEESLPVFVRQTLDIVRQAGNTESEVVQSSFRTLAVIIRDCTTSHLKEKDLVYLLEILTPDLEEPNRQSAVFALLRAIVSRKFVVAEIYDIMDKVAEIMVTNQAGQVRELCRAVLLQFLLDYPQGKGRLKNQMTFLAQNLSYEFESGRLSVMELLSAAFTKFDTELLREYADLFFVALIMVMANDDSSKCREMAAELIKVLLIHLDVEHRKVIITHLHAWSSEKAQLQLSRVSAQVYGVVVDTLHQDVASYLHGILEDMNAVIRRSAVEIQELEANTNDQPSMDVDVEWQLPYHALNVIHKLLRVHPELTNNEGKIDWVAIGSHLLFCHAWVRNAASRLVGLLFNAVPPGLPEPTIRDDSLVSLPGLIEVAHSSCLQLKSDTLDKTLSLQVVKNLFYVGKCFCMISKAQPLQDYNGNDFEGHEAEMDPEPQSKLESIRSNPLPWLFSKLSYQARSAWLARRNRPIGQDNWSEQPLAIFRWFAAMASHMDAALLETYLVHILTPVYRIIDDDTIHDSSMGDLKTLTQELLELVQNKVGTTKFADVYNRIRQGVATVRKERKMEKDIQTTRNPQTAAHRKILRNKAKKINRVKATRVFAEGKVRNNRTKNRTREG
ncbi:armadillo-type protein [Gautieria morchelliformis]|nr:armadillo-type protein [Gautieria morchelliformis]